MGEIIFYVSPTLLAQWAGGNYFICFNTQLAQFAWGGGLFHLFNILAQWAGGNYFICFPNPISWIGMGNMIVELCSAAILFRVCRYLN